MEVPLIGKVKRPFPWLMGLVAAGILGLGSATYVVIGARTPKVDLNKLTVPAQAQNLTVRITANGSVKPIQSVNLSPKTAGRLAKLFVEQADSIQQGQIIAQMEDADLQARLSQAKANLSKAQASLAEARAGSRPEEIRQSKRVYCKHKLAWTKRVREILQKLTKPKHKWMQLNLGWLWHRREQIDMEI
jgi:HlyD family secretion protein